MEWFEYCVDDEGTMGVMLVGADEAVCGVGASLCNARFRGKGLRCSGRQSGTVAGVCRERRGATRAELCRAFNAERKSNILYNRCGRRKPHYRLTHRRPPCSMLSLIIYKITHKGPHRDRESERDRECSC